MNLEDIQHIAGQHQAQASAHKQADFDVAFEAGMNALAAAKAEGFKNTDTLMEACDELIDAITIQRTDLRPYLALAYLFSILEDFRSAEEYLYAAIKIDPNNPELQPFLEKIQALKKDISTRRPTPPQPVSIQMSETISAHLEGGSEHADVQTLYSELESFILDKLKDLFSTSHAHIEPTVNKTKYTLLLNSYKNLNHVIQYMEQQLGRIKEQLNVSALEEKIMPFKVLQGRYLQSLKSSKQLMEINDTIELWSFKTDKQVQVVNQKLTMSALTYGRVDVDRMMDGCDMIADQLDHLAETENIDIALVEGSYQKLITLVENLNDMVEDSDFVDKNQSKLKDILG